MAALVLGFLVSWDSSIICCAGYSRLTIRDIVFGLWKSRNVVGGEWIDKLYLGTVP